MKRLIIFLSILASAIQCPAQNKHFSFTGTIEYVKSVNMYAILKKNINSPIGKVGMSVDQFKATQHQFRKYYSRLTYNKDETLYVPTEPDSASMFENPIIGQHNIVYQNLKDNKFVAQKRVYEDTYLLKDTISKIKWKLTPEVRVIAGYHCRRANGIVLDSIYVVAFFTEEIPVSGGPETFHGLPGMILELVLPHENVSWYATHITEATVSEKLPMPQRGITINTAQLKAMLLKSLKAWGSYTNAALKGFML